MFWSLEKLHLKWLSPTLSVLMPSKVPVTAGAHASEAVHISDRGPHSKYFVILLCPERCQCKTSPWDLIVATNQLLCFVPNGALSRYAVSALYEVGLNASLCLYLITIRLKLSNSTVPFIEYRHTLLFNYHVLLLLSL